MDAGEIFCPKFVDVKLRGCYRTPTKELIFEEIKKLMEANKFDWGIKDAGKVPKEWMLTILATISPEHEYFDPSFYPVKLGNPQTNQVDDLGDLINMRYKTPKMNLALKEKKITDLEKKISLMEESMERMSLSTMAEPKKFEI